MVTKAIQESPSYRGSGLWDQRCVGLIWIGLEDVTARLGIDFRGLARATLHLKVYVGARVSV